MSLEKIYGRGRTRTREENITDDGKWSGRPKLQATFEPGITVQTVITKSLTDEQIKEITTLGRLSEIEHMLKTNTYVPDERNRSPSPAPTYNSKGQRTNTRELRYKNKFMNERDELILDLLQNVPEYEAPFWYRRMKHITGKLFVPTDEHPEINFMGLLIGPRGNTLRRIERESGAKIGLRGKGSVKGGNANSASSEKMLLEEPLHCQIVADTREQVAKAKKLCQEVIDKAIYSGPGENDFKRNQLTELAILNGTLREESEHICSLCGEKGHTRHDCPNKRKMDYVNTLVCSKCGNVGHLAKDCRLSFGRYATDANTGAARTIMDAGQDKNKAMDDEFASMMRDLNGEDQPEDQNGEGAPQISENTESQALDRPKSQYSNSPGQYSNNPRQYSNSPRQYSNNSDQYSNNPGQYSHSSRHFSNRSDMNMGRGQLQNSYQSGHRPDYYPGSSEGYSREYGGSNNGYDADYRSHSYNDNRSRGRGRSEYHNPARFSGRRHDQPPSYSQEMHNSPRFNNGPSDYHHPSSSFRGSDGSRYGDNGSRWHDDRPHGSNSGYSGRDNAEKNVQRPYNRGNRQYSGGESHYEASSRNGNHRDAQYNHGNYGEEMSSYGQGEHHGYAEKRHYTDDRNSNYNGKRPRFESAAPQPKLQAPPGFYSDNSVSRQRAPPPPPSNRPRRPPPPPGGSR